MTVKTYVVELQDKISANAQNAAGQVKLLTGAMGGLERAATKAAALGDVAGFKRAETQYRSLATEVNRLGAEFGHGADQAQHLHEKSESMFAEFFKAEVAVEAMKKVGEAVLEAGKAVIELGMYAIESSERVQLLTAAFEDLAGGAPGAGKATLDAVRGVARELPESEAVVSSWARTLMGAGITDMTQLQRSLKAVAGAEALVEGGGDRVRSMLARVAEQSMAGGGKVKFSLASLAGSGISEPEFLRALGMTPQNFAAAKKSGTLTGAAIGEAITKAVTEKSAGALAASMSTWDTAVLKGKDMITHLFEGVDTEGIVQEIRNFFGVFDLANPSGQAMKAGIGGSVQFILDKVTALMPMVRHLFLEVILQSLRAYNFVRPLVHSFEEWMKQRDGWDKLATGIKYVAIGLGTVVAAFVLFGAAMLTAGALFTGFITAIGLGVAAAFGALVMLAVKFGEWSVTAYTAARDFVSGFVRGIEEGIGRVVTSVEHMGTSAWDTVKKTLHLGSPSRLMFEAGGDTAEGFAQGIESGNDRVVQASAAMASAPAASPMQSGGGGGGGSQTNHFEVHIKAKDDATAHELAELFEEQLASIMERLALSQGAAPARA